MAPRTRRRHSQNVDDTRLARRKCHETRGGQVDIIEFKSAQSQPFIIIIIIAKFYPGLERIVPTKYPM